MKKRTRKTEKGAADWEEGWRRLTGKRKPERKNRLRRKEKPEPRAKESNAEKQSNKRDRGEEEFHLRLGKKTEGGSWRPSENKRGKNEK